ncbi:MAG TPA: DUF5916 domain-containing protein [Longimicrobium sp.]|nr:DUF5916 domain-containing protein [Longimicrobium sp.]
MISRSPRLARGIPLLVTTLISMSPPAAAQETAQAPAVAARKRHTAVRVEGRAPQVDGKLDDAAWAAAPVLSDFVQKEPVEGAQPTERTEVRFVYDDEALYVGARMYANDPRAIQAPVSRRDNGFQAEHLLVSLDTYLDRRTAYTFGVTASGVRLDHYHPRDHETDVDPSFDPVWKAEARIDSAGWTAEMRIPFSQLRFVDRPEQTWGLNLDRWIPSREEDVYWTPVPRNVTAWASRFGDLGGIRGVRPSRRIEVMPYVASAATVHAETDPGDPFAERTESQLRVGGDVRVGLGPNLTLEATVNPDFGQVEADPAEVNLSAFETFFSEKRPFFTEGAQLLQGSGPGYFYSRRIGAAPRCRSLPGDYADCPEASTILGAAKLTGRLASGTSVGALAAVTDQERVRLYDAAADSFWSLRLAPRTAYAVGRVQQEFGPATSTAGLSLTAVHRDLAEGSLVEARHARDAVTGGGDWNLRFRGGEYVVYGHLGGSWVTGDSAAILLLQEAPARYYQRPDQAYVEVDPSRTSLFGWSGAVGVQRQNGKHWLWDVYGGTESPGFELNDAGSLGTADGMVGVGSLTYRETTPKDAYRSYSVSLSSENEWAWDGVRKFGALRTDASVTWKNFWRTNLTAWVDFPAQSTTATRGGPRLGTSRAWVVIGQLLSRASAPTTWNGRVYYGRNEAGELTYRLSGGVTVTPGPRWRFSVTPNYLRYRDPRQYVATLPGGPAETYGDRYLFSFLDQSTFLAQLRLNYTFTPDLSLELYAEPFAASGRWYDFGELPRPRSEDLRFYGPADPLRSVDGEHVFTHDDGTEEVLAQDFNVRSLRSNAVLRWEWRPGSTLFVVWQQDRSSETIDGRLVGIRSLGEAFEAAGDNFLAIKMTYWLPVR